MTKYDIGMTNYQIYTELLDSTLTIATEREVLQQKIKKEKNKITKEAHKRKIEIIEEIVSRNMDTIHLLEGGSGNFDKIQ